MTTEPIIRTYVYAGSTRWGVTEPYAQVVELFASGVGVSVEGPAIPLTSVVGLAGTDELATASLLVARAHVVAVAPAIIESGLQGVVVHACPTAPASNGSAPVALATEPAEMCPIEGSPHPGRPCTRCGSASPTICLAPSARRHVTEIEPGAAGGIRARCTCGWTSQAHSGIVAPALVMDAATEHVAASRSGTPPGPPRQGQANNPGASPAQQTSTKQHDRPVRADHHPV